jgi:hypothetical protein
MSLREQPSQAPSVYIAKGSSKLRVLQPCKAQKVRHENCNEPTTVTLHIQAPFGTTGFLFCYILNKTTNIAI